MQTYILVGAGGTGTHLLPALTTYLRAHHRGEDWQLVVADGDTVETHNLDRQLFDPGTVTANKAEAAITPYEDQGNVFAKPVYIGANNIGEIIRDGDTVLIAADNFTIRKMIELRAQQLQNMVVINGGNERTDGSCQIYVREDGEDMTPPLSFLHPEIKISEGEDRAAMTCAQVAALPGGEQVIVANMASALWMLTSLWRHHESLVAQRSGWTELQFDLLEGKVDHMDRRPLRGWTTNPQTA